ncbi:putative poly(A) polymerase [Xylariaceae sp. FL0804]|nr:putative poly(A) polymerase [Xylariaceae sp. FL0804]
MEPDPKRVKAEKELLPAERLLRELLLECAQHFPELEIWVTGGWVRDRLLGIPSDDLDFALSTVTGREFGKFLESFYAKPEIESKYRKKAADLGISDSSFTRFHIMEKNAATAKNLETAGAKLFGLDIDLVNLRKEVYNGHSRNPEMEFGTAEEDAFRRDATANALFFHLERQEVVDLTGRGLKDLDARVMTTPLDPHQTFMDDPLRVLRLIRLGSKLGFDISPEAMHCMKDNATRRALDTIITRDRINIELFKMMKDPKPSVAFQHLFAANLYVPVFLRLDSPLVQVLQNEYSTLGPHNSPPWPRTWPRAYQLLDDLLKNSSNLCSLIQFEEDINLWFMAAYAPIAGLRYESLKRAVQEATDAIRAPTKLSKLLENSLRNFDSIRTVVDTVTSQQEKPVPRSLVGMAIRSWGPNWVTQVAYVMLAEAVYTSVPRSFSAFADFVYNQDLRDAHLRRPLLNGNEIQTLFGVKKGGKFIKSAIDDLVAWQFDHVDGGVEEARAWLIDQKERLGIPSDGKADP